MWAIQNHKNLELQTIATGSMVLERFGRPVDVVRNDGFVVDSEIYSELEGSTPTSMAKSLGFALVEFASELNRLRPDLVLVIGDRYEALAAAIAAAYMNTCIVHLQGGEVSGSIDESARHAITKVAHFHFPATLRAREYLLRMGETPDSILGVGCPSSDIARTLDRRLTSSMLDGNGSGAAIDFDQPYLLVIYHPTTTFYGTEADEMTEVLAALSQLSTQTILLWPNIDAGADRINKAIRVFRETHKPAWLRTITNLAPETFLKVLAGTSCAIGNSSSFVRDASYFGTPVVLVGGRQAGREMDRSVAEVPTKEEHIVAAVRRQLAHGRYSPSALYGDGYVADRVAEGLARLRPYVQKRLNYIYDQLPEESHASAWHHNGSGGIESHTPEEHRAFTW
jgi:UDP-hydrolysing UDP-N-acetyl-D-glucosamine 2-epimerase